MATVLDGGRERIGKKIRESGRWGSLTHGDSPDTAPAACQAAAWLPEPELSLGPSGLCFMAASWPREAAVALEAGGRGGDGELGFELGLLPPPVTGVI